VDFAALICFVVLDCTLHTIAMDTWTVVLENVQEHKTLFGMCDPKSEGFLFDRTLWNTPEFTRHWRLTSIIITAVSDFHSPGGSRDMQLHHHVRYTRWFKIIMSNFIFAILSVPALQIPVRYGCGAMAMTSFLLSL